ncbi:MAG: hypothetical protein ABJN62_06635 [Halioglobus sp.]
MTDNDYELLSQYLDQELDDLTARHLEQRLSSEPKLQATLNRLSNADTRLKRAFSGTDKAPTHLKEMLRPTPSNVVAFPQRSRPAWQYAVAASLVAAVGLILTPKWQDSTQPGPSLASVLETTPSMANGWKTLSDGRDIRPVLSFKEVDGAWCREYLVSVEGASERGVACRDEGYWKTRVIAPTDLPGDAADYRPAGAGDADEVAQYLRERADGIALSASAEETLISASWKD